MSDNKHPVFKTLHTLQYKTIGNCQGCKLSLTRKHVVFGAGNPLADLVAIGEGPGAEEDKRGDMLIGPTGVMLARIFQTFGYDRRNLYLMNVVKCRACDVMESGWVKNRPPSEDELKACFFFFSDQLSCLPNKRLIITFGSVPAHRVLHVDQGTYGMYKLRQKVIESRYGPVVCTYHPSYLLRNAEEKIKVYEDMKFAMEYLRHPKPESDPKFEALSVLSAVERRGPVYREIRDTRKIGQPLPTQKDTYSDKLIGI